MKKEGETPVKFPEWEKLVSIPADFNIDSFYKVSIELIYHPERNTSKILRADIVRDCSDPVLQECDPSIIFQDGKNFKPFRLIERELLPRMPLMFKSIRQTVTCFRKQTENEIDHGEEQFHMHIVENDNDENIPFYYPKVKGLIFHYKKEKDSAFINVYALPFLTGAVIEEKVTLVGRHYAETIRKHR